MDNIDDSLFEKILFWIQLHRVPARLQMEKVGRLLGKQVGDVLDVDTKRRGSAWGCWLKVRTLVSVSKSLIQGCWLNIVGGKKVWVAFKYEKFPYFYFVDCPAEIDNIRSCQSL